MNDLQRGGDSVVDEAVKDARASVDSIWDSMTNKATYQLKSTLGLWRSDAVRANEEQKQKDEVKEFFNRLQASRYKDLTLSKLTGETFNTIFR